VNGRRSGGESFPGRLLRESSRPHRVAWNFVGQVRGTRSVRYARGVNDSDRAPWAEPPVTPLASGALDGRGTDTTSAPWADPPELVAVRASVTQAQERIERATRQLELAAELEVRLHALLKGAPGQGVPPVASPERRAAELEATGILLKAELRAAKILNDTANPDGPGSYTPAAIELEAARALEGHLAQLGDIEAALAGMGRQLIQQETESEPGPSRLVLDGAQARRQARPVGQSVPVPLFRRPRRGNPA
jgi:hypothetical protein